MQGSLGVWLDFIVVGLFEFALGLFVFPLEERTFSNSGVGKKAKKYFEVKSSIYVIL